MISLMMAPQFEWAASQLCLFHLLTEKLCSTMHPVPNLAAHAP